MNTGLAKHQKKTLKERVGALQMLPSLSISEAIDLAICEEAWSKIQGTGVTYSLKELDELMDLS